MSRRAISLDEKFKALREIIDNKKTVIQVALELKVVNIRLNECIERLIGHG